jgi:branched-chain amino acid transport system ATP-binding protein
MTALLRAENVSVRFGGLQALDDVSLEVREGTVVGLIGPNGAGKTTLFNVISGLQPPTSGAIHYSDQDITGVPPHRRAAMGIRRSFQNLGLIQDQTVEVNLLAGRHLASDYQPWDVIVRPWRWLAQERESKRRIAELMALFDLEDDRDERVRDLSFAAARFVELAAVLAGDPRILLLDEPTTGLDINESEQLQHVVRALRSDGRTMLIIAHDVGFVMRTCDWVYVLAGGRLLAQGRPEQVQSDEAVIEAYLGGVKR